MSIGIKRPFTYLILFDIVQLKSAQNEGADDGHSTLTR